LIRLYLEVLLKDFLWYSELIAFRSDRDGPD